MRVTELSHKYGLPVGSHAMQKLHVSLLAGQTKAGWLEVHSFPIEPQATRLLVLDDCLAVAFPEPGTGVTFNYCRLVSHQVNNSFVSSYRNPQHRPRKDEIP